VQVETLSNLKSSTDDERAELSNELMNCQQSLSERNKELQRLQDNFDQVTNTGFAVIVWKVRWTDRGLLELFCILWGSFIWLQIAPPFGTVSRLDLVRGHSCWV